MDRFKRAVQYMREGGPSNGLAINHPGTILEWSGCIAAAEDKIEIAAYFWDKAAQLGNPRAMIKLGTCYAGGRGAPKNEVFAAHLWRTAAIRYRSSDAMCKLGDHCLLRGFWLYAIDWYNLAILQGPCPYARGARISVLLQMGSLTWEDPTHRAAMIDVFRGAAMEGDVSSMVNLVHGLLTTHGTDEERKEALGWLRVIVRRPRPKGQVGVSDAYRALVFRSWARRKLRKITPKRVRLVLPPASRAQRVI